MENPAGVSMIAVLPSDHFSVDRVELCTWKNEPTANKRGLVHDFVTRICFRNEDSYSSEDQWRELPCLSGYLLVGTPSLNFFQHGTRCGLQLSTKSVKSFKASSIAFVPRFIREGSMQANRRKG